MIEIQELWENYAEWGRMVIEEELSRKEFRSQIYAFSIFLSETNHDYHYNGTYLPEYVDEFWTFLKCFYRKYLFVKKLFLIASDYPDVSLIIDRYWQQDCIWDNERKEHSISLKACPSHEKGLVCKDKLLIECSILCGTKRFIYQSKIENDEKKKLEEVQKLREFLDNKVHLNDAE